MAVSRRTWCRACGAELMLPRWRALAGLNVGYCEDPVGCLARFRAKRAAAGPSGAPAPAADTPPSWSRLLHRRAS